ncbi:DUF1499 domain-containing protein [Alteromonas stellipolaris]|uniref:DUF1499 domain-containing protein n=1 Tax=Alteromonas stellipolaris TaxID=233316 RepID=UPI001D56F916|nr:DUF1499 domain-containing protein [Alteromonas stellipolaris]MBZ2162658.1 DUF1499 domain-containing protein [Alteromonas stellipolaris]
MKKRYLLICSLPLVGCSVTPTKLGVNGEALNDCPITPNCFRSKNNESQDTTPILFKGSRAAAREKIVSIVDSLPRTTIVEERDNYIRVEFRSQLIGFVDDVEFLLSQKPGDGTQIDFRSASRLGVSDLGVNKARMKNIKALFAQ